MQYQMLRDHSVAEMRSIYAPKVTGSWLLHTLLHDAPLDFFVMFSSTSALLSSPLMCSYAAANSYMDSVAHYRRSRGLPALSINWGTWREVGMATRFDGDRPVVEAQSLSNDQGLQALEELLSQDTPQVAVMPMDWEQWRRLYPSFTRAPFLENFAGAEKSEFKSNGKEVSIRQVALSAAPEDRHRIVQEYLHRRVAHVLGFTAEKLDTTIPITNLGIDSLMAVEIKNQVEKGTGVEISLVQLLQGPTIFDLAAQVARQLDFSTESNIPHEPPPEEMGVGGVLATGAWEEGEL
jgi:acyl carrier protein